MNGDDILREFVWFFAPIAQATQPVVSGARWYNVAADRIEAKTSDPLEEMVGLLKAAGLEITAPMSEINAAVGDLVTAGQSLWTVLEPLTREAVPDIASVRSAVTAIRAAVGSFSTAVGAVEGMPPPQEIIGALMEHLAARYLKSRFPAVWHAACLLGVTDDSALQGGRRGQFDAASIWPALGKPQDQLKETIAWETGLDAEFLFTHVAGLFEVMGVDLSEIDAPAHRFAPIPPDAELLALALMLPDPPGGPLPFDIVASLVELAPDGPDRAGLLAMLSVEGSQSGEMDLGTGWRAGFTGDFDATAPVGLVARPDVLTFSRVAAQDVVAAKATLELRRADETVADRLTLGPLRVSAAPPVGRMVVQTGATETLWFEVVLENAEIALEAQGADGFVAKLLPKPLSTTVSLTAGYDIRSGFYLQRGGGLAVELPVGLGLGGVVTVLAVGAALKAADGADAGQQILALGMTGKAKLGPLGVTVEGLGTNLSGGLPRDLSDTEGLVAAFKRPTGLGLTLETGPVKGGGYISHDPENGQYVGALSLDVGDLGLSAFGILDTVMPDGGDGYSLLITVSGRFAPIPLGFGFTLSGVGGLLGLHRGVDIDVLRQIVRAGTAGDILAPKDPIGDAPRIARSAGALFPVTRGQHVFGPTVKMGWGQPKELVSLDLALALTLPDPLRLIMLGKVSVAVPDPQVALIRLNMNVFGVLDFTAKTLEAEGALFDSHVQGLPIKGGFAIVTGWGATPSLAFAVGGLHPAFKRPSGFPQVERLGVDLSKGGLSLLLEGYFAITSNSVQLGARAMLKAGAAGFNLHAELGFDALVIFDPFGIDLAIYASASVKRGSRNLCSVSVRGRLRGPGPWIVTGEARIEILFFDVSAKFSKTIGAATTTQLTTVNARTILVEALRDARNWSGEAVPGAAVIDHLGARVPPGATLAIDQKMIPLTLTLNHIGASPIEGARQFTITGLSIGQARLNVSETLRAPFAPGEFLPLSDKEKISGASYEDMPSGVRFAQPQGTRRGDVRDVGTGRACFVVYRDGVGPGAPRRVRMAASLPKQPDRSRTVRTAPPQGRIRVVPETWQATGDTLTSAGEGGVSHSEARAATSPGAPTIARSAEVSS